MVRTIFQVGELPENPTPQHLRTVRKELVRRITAACADAEVEDPDGTFRPLSSEERDEPLLAFAKLINSMDQVEDEVAHVRQPPPNGEDSAQDEEVHEPAPNGHEPPEWAKALIDQLQVIGNDVGGLKEQQQVMHQQQQVMHQQLQGLNEQSNESSSIIHNQVSRRHNFSCGGRNEIRAMRTVENTVHEKFPKTKDEVRVMSAAVLRELNEAYGFAPGQNNKNELSHAFQEFLWSG